MRLGVVLFSAALLVFALAYGFYLLSYLEDLSLADVPLWFCLGLVVSVAAGVLVLWEASWPARRSRKETTESAPPERTGHLCAAGIAAWLCVLLLFASRRVDLRDGPLRMLGPVLHPGLLHLAVPAFVLFAIGTGILAIGRAGSPRAKWIVALAHFTPPLGYVAFWIV